MHANFVHLRLHSAFSLTESTLRISTLTKLVSDDFQPAAAITDTNNMFGALEFAQSMAAAGVQPIMGTQIELEDRIGRGDTVLLAQNDTGYVNLSQLLSKVLMSSNSTQTPACTVDLLANYSEGLILLTGGALTGFVGGQLEMGNWQDNASNGWLMLCPTASISNYNVWTACRTCWRATSLKCADLMNLPLVKTNDCRFEDPSMSEAHDALVCIGTGHKYQNKAGRDSRWSIALRNLLK